LYIQLPYNQNNDIPLWTVGVSSANEADCHDVTEIGIIVGSVVNTITPSTVQNIWLHTTFV
jgi:hypothetical protein